MERDRTGRRRVMELQESAPRGYCADVCKDVMGGVTWRGGHYVFVIPMAVLTALRSGDANENRVV